MEGPIRILVERDDAASTPSDRGFLRVQRLTVRTQYADGTRSEPYRYDVVERDALDAVLMVLHTHDDAHAGAQPGEPLVCMRTALRPPVSLRSTRVPPLPVPDRTVDPMLWELPAGLIETGAQGERAIMETAARETGEETGYRVEASSFARLGPAVYLTPGLCAEKLHVVHAHVDRALRAPDASLASGEVVEVPSKHEWWPLSLALERAAEGVIEDCKTELALSRLERAVRAGTIARRRG